MQDLLEGIPSSCVSDALNSATSENEAAANASFQEALAYVRLDIATEALKAAYARGHYCDLGEKCPGCMAGYALEQITGREWMQEECEASDSTEPAGWPDAEMMEQAHENQTKTQTLKDNSHE